MLASGFWMWYCKLPILTHYAYIDSLGVHIEKSIFSFHQFKKRKIKIPPSVEEQTAIAQVLQAADKEIKLLKAKADKLREQKKGLMQMLLTGKKRLNYDSFDTCDDRDSSINHTSHLNHINHSIDKNNDGSK